MDPNTSWYFLLRSASSKEDRGMGAFTGPSDSKTSMTRSHNNKPGKPYNLAPASNQMTSASEVEWD